MESGENGLGMAQAHVIGLEMREPSGCRRNEACRERGSGTEERRGRARGGCAKTIGGPLVASGAFPREFHLTRLLSRFSSSDCL